MKHLLTLLTGLLLAPLAELHADLEPAWAYELQGRTSLPLPEEPTKLFRVIKRD